PYGEPKYTQEILDKLLDLKEDGSFRMDMSYFNYCQGLTMTSPKFHDLFGGAPRKPEAELTQREMDLAASVQVVTEEIVLRMGRHLHRETGEKNLVLAGGVALNCVANGKLLREGPFENIWIQPAAGDAGGALGAAQFVWYQLLDNPRRPGVPDGQQASLLGPSFSADRIRGHLDEVGGVYREFENHGELVDEAARLMAGEKVVGWFAGRMEFGPRALGARSIIGDARSRKMQLTMNVKIKFRESFRPFAPIVLSEHNHEYFEFEPGQESPYMLLVADVRDDKRLPLDGEAVQAQGLDKLKVARSTIPAITHVDNSARVQTVDAERKGPFRPILERFHELTGCPVAINTSFNIRGEPIVCTPEDAYRCFMATNMDVLVLENFLLLKEEQPELLSRQEQQKYIESFDLD
ncbi:MAG: hypothetical protein GY769_04330, partial [bacterium]|nr:hypothetical protein [bacterium]